MAEVWYTPECTYCQNTDFIVLAHKHQVQFSCRKCGLDYLFVGAHSLVAGVRDMGLKASG